MQHAELFAELARRVAFSPAFDLSPTTASRANDSPFGSSRRPRSHVSVENLLVKPSLLCTLGHIASTRELTKRGVSQYRISRGVSEGKILRIRQGIYGCAHVETASRIAASVGGAITCVSVLREAGVWAGNSRLVHVQLSSGARRPAVIGVKAHWEVPRFEMETPWRAGRMQALWRAIHCLDEENAIAAMESAVQKKFLILDDVRRIGRLAPRRLHPAAMNLVPNSGSGNETIVRRRLQAVGYVVESQAHVPGMGHQDILVEGCLGIEVDGREWHGEDRFEEDHRRILHAAGLGRHTLQLSTKQVHQTWPSTLAVIQRSVEDAVRDRDRRHRRTLIALNDPL